ncbi:PTB domain-containing engulfment adapter protein 1-like isoform X1 [Branchiostoma lanceolatum]|uniref:PTB domain-containing engulfment adapter protein 1-like isoform X1 n=1 Tax=Branchiostoma lanceolatum TaxID=7740 RepID=UPI00345201E0
MNRSTSFMKWLHGQKSQEPGNSSTSTRNWVHPPDVLLKGHVTYQTKLLGCTEVQQAKGTEVVKEAIRKQKFSTHVKRAEGAKPIKVELSISADGLGISDTKNKVLMHNFPLHRISFCADDKTDKRIFAFIAKDTEKNVHLCFVFDSDKRAEEITLTIGQSFDLAYKRFIETSGKDLELRKQFLALQKKLKEKEAENDQLRKRISHLEAQLRKSPTSTMTAVHNNMVQLAPPQPVSRTPVPLPPPHNPPQSLQLKQTDSFDMEPFSPTNGTPMSPTAVNGASFISPTEPTSSASRDLFGQEPFNAVISSGGSQDYDKAMGKIDSQLADLQEQSEQKEGFGAGLTISSGQFSLDMFDPLSEQSQA